MGKRADRQLQDRQDRFIEAARRGDLNAVREMIAEGIDVDGQGRNNEEPASLFAAWTGNLEMLRLLIEAGASPDGARGWWPLVFAVRSTNPEVTRYLLGRGANPQIHDAEFGPPVLEAATSGNLEVFRMLLEWGVSVRGRWGPTILYELDKRRGRPIWEERREAYEAIYRTVEDELHGRPP